MDFQKKMSLMGLCPNSSPCSDTGYLKCVKEDNGWTAISAFEAYQKLREQLIDQEENNYIRGQVDQLFDIAMDWIKEKYGKKGSWPRAKMYVQKEMEMHIEFCLNELSHAFSDTFSDIDYEIWCMMACIIGVK